MHFSDHTGTLTEARLSGNVAERILQLSIEQYQMLTDRQKSEIKWRFLLQHYRLKLLLKKPTAVRRSLTIVIIDLQPLSVAEIADNILVF